MCSLIFKQYLTLLTFTLEIIFFGFFNNVVVVLDLLSTGCLHLSYLLCHLSLYYLIPKHQSSFGISSQFCFSFSSYPAPPEMVSLSTQLLERKLAFMQSCLMASFSSLINLKQFTSKLHCFIHFPPAFLGAPTTLFYSQHCDPI